MRTPDRRLYPYQVISCGKLGVLAQDGWYCSETDAEKWPELAGWRGLTLALIKQYFDQTFFAFLPGWTHDALIMKALGLNYSIIYMGDEDTALSTIESRLNAGLPSFFSLYSPHPLHVQHKLGRISLPPYRLSSFVLGETDYPIDLLEKVASKKLVQLAPKVHELLKRFTLNNEAQQGMAAGIAYKGLTAMESSCAWLRDGDNLETWQEWLPTEDAPEMSSGSDLPCSKGELQSLIESQDPLPVARELLLTNPACAMCVIPCRSLALEGQAAYGFATIECLFKCAHQNENACTDVTGLSNIFPFIDGAALHDRGSVIRLLELVEAEYPPPPPHTHTHTHAHMQKRLG